MQIMVYKLAMCHRLANPLHPKKTPFRPFRVFREAVTATTFTGQVKTG